MIHAENQEPVIDLQLRLIYVCYSTGYTSMNQLTVQLKYLTSQLSMRLIVHP